MLQWLYTYFQVSIQKFSSTSLLKKISSTSDMLHMLQWLYAYVASACYKCFICFRRMLQEMLSCMLQMFHEEAQVVPAGEGGPRVHDTNAAKVDLDVA
jgi:hypothetical protein